MLEPPQRRMQSPLSGQAKSTLQNINARLAEGYSVADLQLVIDFKREHWSANLKMAEYLRPMTLFAPQKFAGYLAGAQRWSSRSVARAA